MTPCPQPRAHGAAQHRHGDNGRPARPSGKPTSRHSPSHRPIVVCVCASVSVGSSLPHGGLINKVLPDTPPPPRSTTAARSLHANRGATSITAAGPYSYEYGVLRACSVPAWYPSRRLSPSLALALALAVGNRRRGPRKGQTVTVAMPAPPSPPSPVASSPRRPLVPLVRGRFFDRQGPRSRVVSPLALSDPSLLLGPASIKAQAGRQHPAALGCRPWRPGPSENLWPCP